MPTNLSPEAKAKWNEALTEKILRKRLRAFQEFLPMIPKHKGNERLRNQVTSSIAALKEEIAAQSVRRSAGRSSSLIEREGSVQVILFGPTNAGRSSLLRALTNAQPTIGEYEFTTQRPIPGMLPFEDIQIQLVELPAPQITENGNYSIQPESVDLLRSSDGLLLVVDLTCDPVSQYHAITRALGQVRISTQKPSSSVDIVREKGSGEIRVTSSATQTSVDVSKIKELLHSYGINNALVRIYGDATLDDIEDAMLENVTLYKPTLLIGNKLDLLPTIHMNSEIENRMGGKLPVLLTSCLTGHGLAQIGEATFSRLGMIRVYTKEPNQPKASERPFVVRSGTTVRELARSIHTDLAEKYRYSRVWGSTSKFGGERVGPEHVLGDRDIVEIHSD
jgi:uncharacterized protein